MRKLISEFVRFPFYANLIIAFLLLAGGVSVVTMKKSFFPERSARMIYVTVFYPGASPTEMEEGITSRIEESIRGLVGIKEINSTSSENSCRVEIETTGDYDIDETLMDVKNAVDGISSFPTAAERPIVYKQRNTSGAVFMNLTGDVDLLTLKEYAQRVEEDLLNSGVVSQVQVFGYPELEISVEAKEEALLRYGLTFNQIAAAIEANNQDISGGQIRSDQEEILVRLRSRSADPNDIGNIVVRGNENGSFIRIRDVATVKKKFSETPSKTLRSGKPVVSLLINKLNEEDLVEITDYCNQYAEDFNAKKLGVELDVAFSYLEVLKSRLNLLVDNGIMGLILVVIALALFLSFRLSLWVAWGIPSAFLAMFIFGYQIGITVNMISLFGMILVIGILVDDGIVIAENIYTHFEKGKSPMKAAVDGTLEVMPAVITSVLTTIVAFMPLLFLKNRMEIMREMAIVVIASLFFSLLEAFFVLPAHVSSSSVLDPKSLTKKKNSGVRQHLDNFINWLRDEVYFKLLVKILNWRYVVVLGLPVALILITFGLLRSGIIKTTVFPSPEFDNFDINIAFAPGSGEKQTLEYLKRFDAAVWEVNREMMDHYPQAFDDVEPSWWDRIMHREVDTTRTFVDVTTINLGSSFSGQEVGAHAGRVSVFPRDLEKVHISSDEIIRRVKEKIGEIPEAEKLTISGSNPWGKPIALSLLGRNIDELQQAREYMFEKLSEMPQIKDIVDNNTLGKQEIRLKLKPKAYFLGLNEATIVNQVRQGFYGGQAQRLQEGRDELRVWVRYPREDRQSIGQLEKMKIKTALGEFPFSELADYSIERSPVSIKRYNGLREIRVEADVVSKEESVTDLLASIEKNIIPELTDKFQSVKVVEQGQQKEGKESMQVMGTYYLIAFLIIVLILMIHFKSFEQPFLVLMMIPLSILGAIWGHGIHGKQISMLSVFGIIALSGVIINDAVVFYSRYNQLLLEGYKVRDAILESGKSRLRPIILTTLTTSIGLYPLILERSFQAQFLVPMAISLAYGVAFGTMFILIFFPAMIHVLNDFRRVRIYTWNRLRNWINSEGQIAVLPSPEEVEIAIIHSKRIIEEEDIDFENVVSGDMDWEEK